MLIFPQSKTAQIQISSKDSRRFRRGRALTTEDNSKVLLLSEKPQGDEHIDSLDVFYLLRFWF